MSTEGQVDVTEVIEQPDIADTDVAAENPEVAEQEAEHVETSDEKAARLEKETHALRRAKDKATAKLQMERQALREARAHLQNISNAQNPNKPQVTQESMQRELQDRAYVVEVATETAATIKSYQKQDPKFVENLKELAEEVGPLVNERGLPTPFLEQIMDCDKPTKVVAYLLKNPEVVAELEDLSPTRLAKKLTLLEAQLGQSPKTSKNPEPIKPIGQKGRGTAKSLEDIDDMDEYIAARAKQGAKWAKQRA